jgi:hypothetical protein
MEDNKGNAMAFNDVEPVQTEPESGGISKGVVMLIAAMSSFLTPFTGSSVNIALGVIASIARGRTRLPASEKSSQ